MESLGATVADRVIRWTARQFVKKWACALVTLLKVYGKGAQTRSENGHVHARRGPRAALVALNEMSNGGLAADTVVSLLESADPDVRATAWWIAGRHPEWGESLSGFFATRLGAVGGSSADHNTLRDELARFADTPSIQTLLAATVLKPPTPEARAIALGAMTGARERSDRWVPAVVAAIDSVPTLCDHVHLPVQSGSTRVLEAMQRLYTREDYLERVAWMKAAQREIRMHSLPRRRAWHSPGQDRLNAIEQLFGDQRLEVATLAANAVLRDVHDSGVEFVAKQHTDRL